MNRVHRLIYAGTAVLALSACETLLPGEQRDPLTSQQWHLVAIERPSQAPVNLTRSQSDRHWAQFTANGDLSLSLDCNRGNARWYRLGEDNYGAGGGLEIGEIAATRALCPAPSYGEEMAATLPLASRYELANGNRTMVIVTRTARYRFSAR